MKPENFTTAAVLNKLRSGESIPDKELVIAIETLEQICDTLTCFGEIFYLPNKFLKGKLEQLKAMREFRK